MSIALGMTLLFCLLTAGMIWRERDRSETWWHCPGCNQYHTVGGVKRYLRPATDRWISERLCRNCQRWAKI